MASYETPRVDVNAAGWGPTVLPEQFLNVPYAPFNKGDKLGKAADFVSNYAPRGGRYIRDPSGVNAEFQYKHDSKEDATFQLVDTSKGTRPKNEDRLRPTWNQQRFGGRGGRGAGGRNSYGDKPDANAATTSSAQLRMKGMQKQNKRWDRLSNARRQFTFRRRDEVQVDRAASVTVQANWDLIDQFELQQLTKLQANIPKSQDIKWCGELREYDATLDRITSRTNTRVHRYDDRDFYYVTTTDDPVIEELAQQGEATVFATDAILAHLMASTRSVFPWDIVAQRVNNMLFFDKRDSSTFDLLSVNENASDPPSEDDPDHMNHPDRLSLEATMINQNLSQQVLKTGNGAFYKKCDNANPFASDDAKPASCAYRYRKFDLGGGLNLVARCEVQAVAIKRGMQQYVNTYALNEYDPKFPGSIEWRKKIDSQRGAILANELKNNSCKLARWTAQALLGGLDEMKLGYVSRSNIKDPYSHVVLGMQSYNPSTFATQIALNQNSTWGIVKMLSELLLEQPEGKYVIMKDPNKPIIRLFSVPLDTFEEEGEDDEEENDE
uniref:Eukaryotic translation initiation factor 3 subunit D n=1 Tax=Hyaloperonospora arabidopsidis (strain Emoy2) TaxID=559515 RepID=M4BKF1_HYAAE